MSAHYTAQNVCGCVGSQRTELDRSVRPGFSRTDFALLSSKLSASCAERWICRTLAQPPRRQSGGPGSASPIQLGSAAAPLDSTRLDSPVGWRLIRAPADCGAPKLRRASCGPADSRQARPPARLLPTAPHATRCTRTRYRSRRQQPVG